MDGSALITRIKQLSVLKMMDAAYQLEFVMIAWLN